MHTITSSPSRLLRWHLVATLNTPTTPSTTTTTTHIPPTSTPKLKPCISSTTSSKVIMNSDPTSLLSTWSHRAWVAAGSTTILIALTNSVAASINSGAIVEPAISALAGYVMADLGTGFYHFAIDNYGSASTPIFGPQIEAFQGHHRRPTTITRRQPANNLHALARAVAFFLLPFEVLTSVLGGGGGAGVQAFVGACAGCVMMSQQFHAWAHERKDRLPWWVEGLQRAGVLISRDMHGVHHRQPYDSNYCIVSGLWNGVLDEYGVFKAVEMVVFFKFGVRPRSWGQTSVEWREEEDVD